jgi:hypothetical protein
MYLREIGLDDINWIDLVQDRGQRWAVVVTLTNFWVSYDVGKFLTERLAASQEGLNFMGLVIIGIYLLCKR